MLLSSLVRRSRTGCREQWIIRIRDDDERREQTYKDIRAIQCLIYFLASSRFGTTISTTETHSSLQQASQLAKRQFSRRARAVQSKCYDIGRRGGCPDHVRGGFLFHSSLSRASGKSASLQSCSFVLGSRPLGPFRVRSAPRKSGGGVVMSGCLSGICQGGTKSYPALRSGKRTLPDHVRRKLRLSSHTISSVNAS